METSGEQAEIGRLAELRHYEILDTRADERFDRLTRLSASLIDVPIAFISFLDDRREWLKSVIGTDITEVSRGSSISAISLPGTDVVEVSDAAKDTRYCQCSMVTGPPNIRFYAGAPLKSVLGFRLGTLCIADTAERRLDERQKQLLIDLAGLVMDEIELHRAIYPTRQNQAQAMLGHPPARPYSDPLFGFVARLTPDGTLIEANLASAVSDRPALDEALGRPIWECAWWSNNADAENRLKTAIAQAANGRASQFGASGQGDDGATHSIDFVLAPMRRGNEGQVDYVIVSGTDATNRMAVERQMRQCEIRFRGTFENAAVGMAHVSLTSRWLSVNQRLLDILGYTEEELLTKTLPEITHHDDVAGHLAQFSRLKVGEIDNYTREKRYVRKDGDYVWVNVTVSLQRSEAGNPLFAIMVIEDITSRKRTEERQRLLLGELNHRVKNIMSMTQSIANQSLRYGGNAEHFATSFRARLQAMARAHDLLTQESWQRANLAELVASQTISSGMVEPDRIQISGPSIFLPGQVVLNFALILHELTSNALRYGALSIPSGFVEVSWTVDGSGADRRIHMTWRETNGPAVSAPRESGFGTRLIDRLLRQALGAKVDINWSRGGLSLDIRLPLPDIQRMDEYFNL